VLSEPRYAVLIPVGKEPVERDRLDQLLDSLFHFEPRCPAVVIVNDHGDRNKLREILLQHLPAGCQWVLLDNCRPERSWPWGGRFTYSLAEGFRWILANAKTEWVLRIDSDCLIIAPFAEQVYARVRAEPEIGLLGSHYHAGRRQPAYRYHAARARRFARAFGLWRRPRWHMRTPWPVHNRKLRQLVTEASARGYEFGESILGGAYAITTEALRRIAAHQLLDDKNFLFNTPISEDHIFTMLVYAVGFGVRSFDSPGEPFRIWHGELPDTPDRLLDAGHAIIHSVKGYPGWSEEAVRAYFRNHRRGPNGSRGSHRPNTVETRADS
jgi:hypothetical protein